MSKSCFVVMAISNQKHNDREVSSNDLRKLYDNLIKKAIKDAYPGIEVIRADEVNEQGTITNDILTRLLFSDFVIVDITYPNPNVYYELGVRHCSRNGTILIKDKNVNVSAPFDISHERYIEYENTTEGLNELITQLKEKFNWFDRNKNQPDNHVLLHAKNSKFNFPQYGEENEIIKMQEEGLNQVISAIIDSDILFNNLIDGVTAHSNIRDNNLLKIFNGIKEDKEAVKKLISGFMKMGIITPQMITQKLLNS